MSESNEKSAVEPTKDDIIREIGRVLAERRLERNLTFEAIHNAIKIRVEYLKAMEEGRWDSLPGEVFVRGFVIRYAGHLGLDGAKLLAPYLAVAQPLRKKEVAGPVLLTEGDRSPFLWILGAVAFVAVLFFIRVFRSQVPPPAAAPPRPAAVSPVPAALPPAPLPAAEGTPPNPGHEIRIFSPWTLWVKVVAQDKTFEGFIPQASTWTWQGTGQFSVRIGYTNGVVLSFDGEPVTLQEHETRLTLPVQ
jgi:cytoskeleton protein RodZ